VTAVDEYSEYYFEGGNYKGIYKEERTGVGVSAAGELVSSVSRPDVTGKVGRKHANEGDSMFLGRG